jgi:hypothetical protein
MRITERVEQLHRVLEAMNAWHAASNGHEPEATVALDGGPVPPVAPAPDPSPAPGPETRSFDALVDDLLPVRRDRSSALEVAAEMAESLGLGYHLGSAVERIATASGQGAAGVAPLREAIWLIDRYAALLERRPIGADLHASTARLAQTGDAIARIRALSAMLEAESMRHGADTAPDTPPAD